MCEQNDACWHINQTGTLTGVHAKRVGEQPLTWDKGVPSNSSTSGSMSPAWDTNVRQTVCNGFHLSPREQMERTGSDDKNKVGMLELCVASSGDPQDNS